MNETQYRKLDLNELTRRYADFHENLQRLTLERRQPGCDVNDRRIFSLRDSLFYRAKSLKYNLYALYEQHGKIIDQLSEKWWEAGRGEPWKLIRGQELLSFLTDNIVFNSVSLFDYFAKYAAHLYSLDNWEIHNWKRLATRRDGKIPADTRELILKSNEGLVRPLSDFRNRVIHERMTKPVARESLNHLEKSVSFDGILQEELARIVRRILPPKYGDKEIDLHDGSEVLVNGVLEILTIIIKSMRTTKDGESINVMM